MTTITPAELVAGNREVIRSVSTGRQDVYMIPLSIVRVREGFNDARKADPDYPAHIRELADSMKAQGWMRHKPLVGVIAEDGNAYPSDGHSRYEAALLANSEGAGIESIPFMPEQKGTNEEDRIFGLILNNNGKRLTPLGEALVIKQLIGRGVDEKEIERRTGFAPAKISGLLALIAAPKDVREMVATGRVAATTAIEVLRDHGSKAVDVLKAGEATAVAAGKTRVTKKHLSDPKAKKPHPDTARIDWMESQTGVIIREWHRPGQGKVFVVCDRNDDSVAEGADIRSAIDNARAATAEE